MREIRLGTGNGGAGSGHIALVDDCEFDRVVQYSWHVQRDGPTRLYAIRGWYENGHSGSKHYQRMHTFITGWSYVDHIDHNGLNNCWSNMREATDAQNTWNKRAHRGTTSCFKGVYWHRQSGRWRAQIMLSGRNRHLGNFTDEIEAARAYDAAAREAFGAFAALNFPLPGEQGSYG